MITFLDLYLTSPITWLMFLGGLIIGSFLNVCIYRIPEKTFWKNTRSVCRNCQVPLPWHLNIPVLSYVLLRGRASCCATKISWQYPTVEFITGVLFVFIYWRMPFLLPVNYFYEIQWTEFIRFSHAVIFCCLMLVCAVIDLRLMIIPDVLTLGMITLTPLVVFLHPDLDWRSALIGVLVGGLSLYAVAWAYWLVRREIGLGMGDVKLLAGIGGWLGYQAIFPTIVFASVLGTFVGVSAMIVSRKINLKSAIPFGPFLALGAFLHFIFGAYIQEWLFTWTLHR